MPTLPLSQVKDRLSELVESAQRTRDSVVITCDGTPAAVLLGIDEWESIQETLYWLSRDDVAASIAEADQDIESARLLGEDDVRREFQPLCC